MFILTKLKSRVIKFKSSKIYLIVAILQLLAALSLLIPTIYNVEKMFGSEVSTTDPLKILKLCYESSIYIVFEVWRIWLVLDGIIQMNSLTIYTTAVLEIFSVGLSLMTLYEYSKLSSDDPNTENLLAMNKFLQIAFSGVLFVFAIPTLWYAYRVKKDFGWGVYKKIGKSLDFQRMYQVVQCLSLMIKLDVFFELVFVIVLTFQFTSPGYLSVLIITPILTFISIVIVREAVARESHILMILFLFLQVEFMTAATYFLVFGENQFNINFVFSDWYALALFFICSALSFLISVVLAIWCQINFNKGLKEHVQWSFFGLKKLSGKNDLREKQDDLNGLLSTKIDMPIDDD